MTSYTNSLPQSICKNTSMDEQDAVGDRKNKYFVRKDSRFAGKENVNSLGARHMNLISRINRGQKRKTPQLKSGYAQSVLLNSITRRHM